MARNKTIIFYLLTFITFITHSQVPITDTHIVNQEKRMVFEKWGDFQPNPDYILGIQINPHYTFTWGWFAPNQNGDYRDGSDIRPYDEDGLGTLSTTNLVLTRNIKHNIEHNSDDIKDNADKEISNSMQSVQIFDPLYTLYYSKQLLPIRQWDEQVFLANLAQKFNTGLLGSLNLTTEEITQLNLKLLQSGIITRYIDQMDIFKETFELNRDMPLKRGKRLLGYHRLFLDYRAMNNNFEKSLIIHARLMVHLLRQSEVSINSLDQQSGITTLNSQDDLSLFNNIIINSGDLIKF